MMMLAKLGRDKEAEQVRDFMMDFAVKTVDFALKMMNLDQAARRSQGAFVHFPLISP